MTDTTRYNTRIDAMSYAMEHDDGQSVRDMQRAQVIIIASLMTGFTFPGMMELPGWMAGRLISASPEVRPLESHRMSLAIFISATASELSAPEAKT